MHSSFFGALQVQQYVSGLYMSQPRHSWILHMLACDKFSVVSTIPQGNGHQLQADLDPIAHLTREHACRHAEHSLRCLALSSCWLLQAVAPARWLCQREVLSENGRSWRILTTAAKLSARNVVRGRADAMLKQLARCEYHCNDVFMARLLGITTQTRALVDAMPSPHVTTFRGTTCKMTCWPQAALRHESEQQSVHEYAMNRSAQAVILQMVDS